MKYRLTVTRIDPHPKAGEPIPGTDRWNGYDQTRQVFPDTTEAQCLLVVLSEEEYGAVKKACIGAAA